MAGVRARLAGFTYESATGKTVYVAA